MTQNSLNLLTLSRRKFVKLALASGLLTGCHPDDTPDWSVWMADSVLKRHPVVAEEWRYEAGVILTAIQQVWLKTKAPKYYDYLKSNIDSFVIPNGDIRTYRLDEYNLDQINEGKPLFLLYQQTGDDRYRQAAHHLRQQLQTHPRTDEGGFWHKQIYPYQMWLDGLYMAGPFYAEFSQIFDEPAGLDDVVHQFTLIERHTRDPQTGLFYHAWDESKSQRWADPQTGCSPHFWGRAMGWYMMALVDTLEVLSQTHPGREILVTILKRTTSALAAAQDAATGLWYQVLDQGDRAGNYLEASASCMLVYALAKGFRQGYLSQDFLKAARRGYEGILEHFIEIDERGLVNLNRICQVAGLGGTPYRDGSFDYYINEPIVTNDYKGVGPFIMASVEIETLK
jgi:unsaturated rhamnogalacturonyl hydrolase